MTAKVSIRQPRSLFTKETKLVLISGVKPSEAKELHDELRFMFSQHGYNSNYEFYVNGETVNGVKIYGSDNCKSAEDLNHFLQGFELAMSMGGVDVTNG